MFCPEDCIHIHEIEQNCIEVALQIAPYKAGFEAVFDPETNEIDYAKSQGERRRVLEGIVFNSFLNRHVHAALAVGPDGEIRRLSMHAIRPVLYNHFRQFTRQHCQLGTQLLFVDMSTGTIDLNGMTERATVVDLENLSDWWKRISILLSPLDGWTVCFKRSEVKSDIADIRAAWDALEVERSYHKGRPRIQEKVLAAYNTNFPKGHVGYSWKHVLSVVSEAVGTQVSIDTLRRSLGLRA